MPDVNMEEIGRLLTDQAKAFEAYKAANDSQISEIKKKGSADVLTVEQVKRIDDALTKSQEDLQAVNTKLKAVEILAARPKAGEGKDKDPALVKCEEDFGKFLRKGDGGKGQIQFEPLQVKADGQVLVDPQGGFYVPPSFSSRIVERIFETTMMRTRATVMATGGDDIEFLANTNDIDAGWVGETQARTKTGSMQPSKVRIPVNEGYANPPLTQKLLDDAYFDVEGYLTGKIADRLTRLENSSFINGDGVNQPRGITTYSTIATDDETRAWGKLQYVPIGFTSISAWLGGTDPGDVLLTLIYKLKTELLAGASWMMPRSVLTGVRQLKNEVGGYLWQPSYQLGQPATLLDYPVDIAPDMPAVTSNSLSAAFGNFKEGYTIADRTGLRLLRDPYTNKPYIQFYATKRTGGDVVNFEAIKFLKFAAS